MRKYITVLVLAIVAGTGNIYAQYAPDALRFSQTNYGSSARFKGLGNAQISLGGDISSLGGNPAGLGMFTKSEFAITPEFNNTQSKATYLGQKTNDNKSVMNLNQIGAVWYSPVTKPRGADLDKGLLSVVWGLGYNRNNDFGSRVSFGGVNSSSSIANAYAQEANGFTLDNMGDLPYMAYQNRLIDQDAAGSTSYLSAGSLNNQQNYTEVRSGSTSELDFSAGLNFSNQLYLGASIGVVNVRYLSDYVYSEAGVNTSTDPENEQAGRDYNLSLRQSQTTDGSGVNGRLGLIYKPINAVRIGATFQTPTWMHVEDNTVIGLDTRYHSESGSANFTNQPANYNFIYSLRTPYKGSLGASVIIGNHALLSADVDYVDYSSMKFSTAPNTDNDFDALDAIRANNDQIKSDYSEAINYRVGGEYKIGALALRAGFAYNGSPYKIDDNNDFATKYYSGGIGYRFGLYYLDLAYQRAETHNTYSPYALNDGSEPIGDVDLNKNNVFLTLGINF